MIVCQCAVVNERAVDAAVAAGASTLGQVCRSTGAGRDCGTCVFSVKRALDASLQRCQAHGDVVPPISEVQRAAS